MKEAKCKECGAIYTLEEDFMPKILTCTCECTKFKVASMEA